jgi:hypothetical protein
VDLLRVRSGEQVLYGQLVGVGFDAAALKRRELGVKGGTFQPGVLQYGLSGMGAFMTGFRNLNPELDVLITRKRSRHDNSTGRQRSMHRSGLYTDGSGEECLLRGPIRAQQIEIAKREYYGNRFKICPGVLCNGGAQEVFLFTMRSPLHVLMALPMLWKGNHRWLTGSKKDAARVDRYRAHRTCITSPTAFDFHVDGELMKSGQRKGTYQLEVTVIPRAVRFLVPERFYRFYQHASR